MLDRRSFLRTALAFPVFARAKLQGAPELSRVRLSFIQVSDTHVSVNRLFDPKQGYDVSAEESIRRTRAVVAAINECSLPYEFIVHTGDVAHTRETTADFDLARELLQFRRPAYFVPGNHDVGYSETPRYLPAFEERFGKANQAFEPAAGLRFVLFNSQPLDHRAPEEHRVQAFRVLDELLKPPKPTILFCHAMGLASFHLNRLFPGWPEEVLKAWVSRMKAGGVFAVLAGHFHRDEIHVVDGLPFYLAGPVINFWGRQTCFRHWQLENGQLSYRTIYLEL